jgi:hypothetical protein
MAITIAVLPDVDEPFIDLAQHGPLTYEITHVERVVDPPGTVNRLSPSRWLTIVPLTREPGSLPSVSVGSTGTPLVAPLPQRRVPERPRLQRPTAELYEQDPTPTSYADRVALARRWTYGFDVAAELRSGNDELCGRIIYNAPLGTREVATGTPAAPRIPGLFEALVIHDRQVAPYWPVIVTEAARRATSSSNDPSKEERFQNACARYAESVERVLNAFRASELEAAPPASSEDRFVIKDVTRGSGRLTSIQFVDHLENPAKPVPVLAGEGEPWVRIRLIDKDGRRHPGTPRERNGRLGELTTNPVGGDFVFEVGDDTPGVRRREIQIGRLDVLRQGSVWVAASVRRNDQIADKTVNRAFVYRTAEVYLQEVVVPNLRRRKTIELKPEAPLALRDALLAALAPVFAGLGDRKQPVQIRLDYESGRMVELVEAGFGSIGDEPTDAFVPEPDPKVMLAGVRVTESGASGWTVTRLADELRARLAATLTAHPIGRRTDGSRGRLVLNVTIRTADDRGPAQPLLRLERLALDLGRVTDI